jgi:predicted AlkP superfamily phosphohydrolase/phosphomutase
MAGLSLWNILSSHDLRVGIVNVPMTYPPEAVNGFLISGLGTPDYQTFTYPPDLSERLLRNGYRVNRRMFHQSPGDEQAFIDDTYDISERLTQATLRLMAEEPWDFFMVVYRDTDEMAHAFWSYMDDTHPIHNPTTAQPYRGAILDCYRRMDKAIGKLIEAAGPETSVFIISDHGTGPLYKDVFLNEWLRREGFLVTKTPKSTRRILARMGLTRANVSRVLRALGLLRVERWIKDLLGERIAALPRDTWGDFDEVIEWSQTTAYSYGYHGQIYINLAGREPQGIVNRDDFERVRTEIRQALDRWMDPADGRPVVSATYTSDELFHGPHTAHAPDLVVVMRDLAYITRHRYEFGDQPNLLFTEPLTHETGGHRLNGVLIASGPGLAQIDGQASEASLMDITPTVLHLLGCPVPEHIDGQVIVDRLTTDWRARPVRTFQDNDWAKRASQGDGLSRTEERELLDRLRKLGYLE